MKIKSKVYKIDYIFIFVNFNEYSTLQSTHTLINPNKLLGNEGDYSILSKILNCILVLTF